MKFVSPVHLIVVITFVATSAAAQSTDQDPQAAPLPAVVNLPFFAEEGHGNPRTAITPAELSILDSGRPPQSLVAIRTARESPLRLGVLIDSSSSEGMSRLYRPGLDAITDLLHHLLDGSDDKVFIVNFSSALEASPFMSGQEFLKFHTNATPGGGTAFFDAVQFACKERMEADPTQFARRVLVILSDGDDNMSHVTAEQAIAAAQEAGTVIFAVSTGEITGMKLQQFGEKTGGRAFLQLSPKDIPGVFRSIQEQIDNMYILTYVPQEPRRHGERRTIEMKAISDKKLKFRAPKAYYVSKSAP